MDPSSLYGKAFETSTIRYRVCRSSVTVTELANAGKRGKEVRSFTLYDVDMIRDPKLAYNFECWLETLPMRPSYEDARLSAKLAAANGGPKFDERTLRGIDVVPPGKPKLVVEGQGFYLEAEWNTFMLRDTTDPNNEPTVIPKSDQKKGPQIFYAWVEKNRAALTGMTFSSVWEQMAPLGVKGHFYCAVD